MTITLGTVITFGVTIVVLAVIHAYVKINMR